MARLKRERSGNGESFYIASKAGQRSFPHIAEGYTLAALIGFVKRSLQTLEAEAIDLLQLDQVYARDAKPWDHAQR